jgi:hypothetical protein
MDRVYIVSANLTFVAGRADLKTDLDLYNVVCMDALSGKTHFSGMSSKQLEAVVSCLISKGSSPEQYAIAAVAVEGFPVECRPIP